MSDRYVVIACIDRVTPVYHALDHVTGPEYVQVMRCGARVDPSGWWTARLRRKHADLFARPCRLCFPAATKEALG